jgi:phosphoenolpyruvate-protein kinase (PTS system EI component)
MMLETKEALDHILEFKNLDFISIGTNDLTHDIYHINRDDALDLFDNYIDDLIEKLKIVVKFAKDNNIYLSVCGELASVPSAALKFYEIGIRNLSVSPSMIKTLNSIYSDYKNNK